MGCCVGGLLMSRKMRRKKQVIHEAWWSYDLRGEE